MKKFWLVWNPNNRWPIVRHMSHLEACLEAKRLAQKHAGETFIVMESKDDVTFGAFTWNKHDDNISLTEDPSNVRQTPVQTRFPQLVYGDHWRHEDLFRLPKMRQVHYRFRTKFGCVDIPRTE